MNEPTSLKVFLNFTLCWFNLFNVNSMLCWFNSLLCGSQRPSPLLRLCSCHISQLQSSLTLKLSLLAKNKNGARFKIEKWAICENLAIFLAFFLSKIVTYILFPPCPWVVKWSRLPKLIPRNHPFHSSMRQIRSYLSMPFIIWTNSATVPWKFSLRRM